MDVQLQLRSFRRWPRSQPLIFFVSNAPPSIWSTEPIDTTYLPLLTSTILNIKR